MTCIRCHGRGYTKAEAPVVKSFRKNGKRKFKTVALGSGCTLCRGKVA